MEKFRLYELEKAKNFPNFGKRKRHGSGASVSSLPHNLEILENVSENSLQKDLLVSSREELSSSSGVSSCESISQKSLDTNTKVSLKLKIFCLKKMFLICGFSQNYYDKGFMCMYVLIKCQTIGLCTIVFSKRKFRF